jgi:thioredoxin-related protein
MICDMRIIAGLAIFILVFSAGLPAWGGNDYNESLRKARAENKPLLIFFYNQYCQYCEAMEKEVFKDKEIQNLLRDNVVFLRVDGETKEDLARFYNVRGYPTTALLEPTGSKIGQIPGYISKPRFKAILTYLKEGRYRKTTLRQFLSKNQ